MVGYQLVARRGNCHKSKGGREAEPHHLTNLQGMRSQTSLMNLKGGASHGAAAWVEDLKKGEKISPEDAMV